MVNWKIVSTKQAQKDAKKLKSTGLKEKTLSILEILKKNPRKTPPNYEKLDGDQIGRASCRERV